MQFVREVGGELRRLVVDLDRDDAALLVGRDADELGQRLAQRLEILDLVALFKVQALVERTDHAVALEQRNVQLVGRLGADAARQPAERAKCRERRSRTALLLRTGRQQRGARGVHRRQDQRNDERDDGRCCRRQRDDALALAEPGQQIDEADLRAAVFAFERRVLRQFKFGGLHFSVPQSLSVLIAAAPRPNWEKICDQSFRLRTSARPQVS